MVNLPTVHVLPTVEYIFNLKLLKKLLIFSCLTGSKVCPQHFQINSSIIYVSLPAKLAVLPTEPPNKISGVSHPPPSPPPPRSSGPE